MYISTKTGYALRALYDIALNSDKKPVSITDICHRQNLPKKYVEQLFRKLKISGLITSSQGAKGGYLLTKKIDAITLKDIIQSVDENYKSTYCDSSRLQAEYCSGIPCGFHDLWDEIKEHIDKYYESIKLDSIIKKVRRNNE